MTLPTDLPDLDIDEPPQDAVDLDNLGLPPPANACAYCSERSTSDEHVLPKWVSRFFGKHGGVLLPGPHGARPAIMIPITADRVCTTCNNTWLSVLENDTAPILESMILGCDRSLTTLEQTVVVTWAFKTALMLDLSGDAVIPLGYYREFALQRRPPQSSVVWLGAYSGSMAFVAYSEHLQFDARPGELPKAVVTTFSVGRVLFQVLHHFTAGTANLREGRALAAGLDRVWPPGPTVAWPRGRLAFGDAALAELSKSIHDDGGDLAN